MAGPLVFDRVRETTTSTGTGAVALGGAPAGFRTFASVLANLDSCYYCIEDGTNWEVGVGTFTAAGATLSRDTVLASNNAGAAVNFAAGTKNVFLPAAAETALTRGTQTVAGAKTFTSPLTAPLVDKGGAVYSVDAYGAKGDTVSLADGALTSGSPTLTSATGLFTAADVGKRVDLVGGGTTRTLTGSMTSGSGVVTLTAGSFGFDDIGRHIIVPNAGAAGATLRSVVTSVQSTTQATLRDLASTTSGAQTVTVSANLSTTIAGYTSATTVTLAANSGGTLSSLNFNWGSDDTAALAAAVAACPAGGTVFLPQGSYKTDQLVIGKPLRLVGAGRIATFLLPKSYATAGPLLKVTLASKISRPEIRELSVDLSQYYNYGLRSASDCAITVNTQTLTSATFAFTDNDIGRTISIVGAGPAAGTLTTTIMQVNSATSVVLRDQAGTTVSGQFANLWGPIGCIYFDDTDLGVVAGVDVYYGSYGIALSRCGTAVLQTISTRNQTLAGVLVYGDLSGECYYETIDVAVDNPGVVMAAGFLLWRTNATDVGAHYFKGCRQVRGSGTVTRGWSFESSAANSFGGGFMVNCVADNVSGGPGFYFRNVTNFILTNCWMSIANASYGIVIDGGKEFQFANCIINANASAGGFQFLNAPDQTIVVANRVTAGTAFNMPASNIPTDLFLADNRIEGCTALSNNLDQLATCATVSGTEPQVTLLGHTVLVRGGGAAGQTFCLKDATSGTTPKKFFRVAGGNLQVLNDAFTTPVLLVLTDAGKLALFDGQVNVGGVINSNTTPVTVAANVATDQNLMSFSLPANGLNALGRTLRIYGAGVYTLPATNTPLLTFKVKLGAVTLASFVTVAATPSVTAVPWSFEFNGTVTLAGASGTLECHGTLSIRLGAGAGAQSVFNDTNTAVSGAVNLTTANTLQITVASSIASASNSFTQRQMVSEVLNY